MSENHEQKPDNRSSALSPEALGAINMAMAAAVKEAVTGIMLGLAPTLGAAIRDAGRDPEKDAARAKQIEREIREMTIWKEDEEANRKLIEARQNQCPHLDENGRTAIQLVHNFPDQHPRGLCAHCHALVHPKEWRIGAPTKEFPRGKPYLVPAHKDYMVVMQIQHRS